MGLKRWKKKSTVIFMEMFRRSAAFSSKIQYWLYDDIIHPSIGFTVPICYIMIQLLEMGVY